MNQREDNYSLISAYLDGELGDDEIDRLQQLLATDEDCRRELEALRSVSADIRRLPVHQLDEHFAARVMAAVRIMPRSASLFEAEGEPRAASAQRPVRYRHWSVAVGVSICAAATLLVAFLLVPSATTAPRVATRVAPNGQVRALAAAEDAAASNEPARSQPPTGRQEPARALVQSTRDSGPRDASVREEDRSPPTVAGGEDVAAGSGGLSVMVSPGESTDNPLSPARGALGDLPPRPGSAPVPPSLAANADMTTGKIDLGPGRLTQRISLLIDVTLSDSDQAVAEFEEVLRTAGVAFDSNIRVEKELEAALLASRYFEPAEQAAEVATCSVVFVVSPARAIDQVWQRLQDSPDTFARVAIDIALQPADAELFRRLRELSLVAGGTGFESPAAAHRLDLPTAWTGVVAQPNARSSTARVTLSSSPLGAGQGEASRRPGLVGFLGGDVSVETIFVLHVAPEGDR